MTIAPRRAASAPQTPSRSGGWSATLPCGSATGAWSSATSGTSGASSPTSPGAEGRRDAGVGVVRLHRAPRDRPGDDRREPARRGLQPLREREERPVLDFDLAALVRAGEPRVRREVRERVARVARHDLAHETAAEEERSEARQREHHQRELRVAAPPLPDDLAGRGRPTRVPDDRVEHVAGAHVRRDRFGQRRPPVGHGGTLQRDPGVAWRDGRGAGAVGRARHQPGGRPRGGRRTDRAPVRGQVGGGAARRPAAPARARGDRGVRRTRLPPHLGRGHRAARADEPHDLLRVLRQP
ncbi:MAG: hypothetical protein KatS3mg010_0974 [Acidimicrobiia bacterium]|nr:MAG: hypothetical protein KatS3mg010_0974 [Acidimicrobiia bacterium]